MVNNYERGKIYKIVCNITGKQYVGSTTEPSLARRLAGHKGHYNSYLKGKRDYITSFEILKNGNYFIELICNASCNSRDELSAVEGTYIRELKCINKNITGRTIKQYRDDNVDRIKQYRDDNVDKHKQLGKQYRKDNTDKLKQKNNCLCGGRYTHTNKSVHLKSIKHLKYLNI